MSADGPVFVETPLEAITATVRETVFIDEYTFHLVRPAEIDSLLNHKAIQAAFEADEYMPYWSTLWPAARMLARAVLREAWPTAVPRILEVGCGLGLPGIAALRRGGNVTFSDCDRTALRFAADNARLNGLTVFETRLIDWRHPPADDPFDVILASDLIFERRHVEPIVEFVKRLLAPKGLCLLMDQDRPPSEALPAVLESAGFQYERKLMRAGEPGGHRYKGTLYRITHRR